MSSGVEFFGLASSIQSTVEILGQVITIIRSYADQDKEESDLRLRFEMHSRTLERLAPALKRIQSTSTGLDISAEEQKLTDEVETHLGDILARLQSKLGLASTAGKSGRAALASRAAWALWRRSDMGHLEKALFEWIQRVEISYAVLEANLTRRRLVVSGIQSAEDRIGLLVDIYNQIKARDVTGFNLRKDMGTLALHNNASHRVVAWFKGADGQERQVIVEYTAQSYSEDDDQRQIKAKETATCDLTKILVHSNPDRTLILRALGYFHDETRKRFGLIYEIPPGEQWAEPPAKILTLSDLLAKRPHFSLAERLKLCCNIAKAVLYIHVMNWVHKGLRPDNILFLGSASQNLIIDAKYTHILPPCYVAGFEHSRSTEMYSDRTSDADWAKNLYRHPNRHGRVGNSEYSMAHDIYSLGVMLLEIGLWSDGALVPFQKRLDKLSTSSPLRMKDSLVKLATGITRPGVATYMGDKYADVVRYCLEFSQGSVPPGSQFVQDVWLRLDTIRAAL